HVEVLPLAEATGRPDPLRLEPLSNGFDVAAVSQVVDDVGGEDLLRVDEFDLVVVAEDSRSSKRLHSFPEHPLAIEWPVALVRHLGRNRALPIRNVPRAEATGK